MNPNHSLTSTPTTNNTYHLVWVLQTIRIRPILDEQNSTDKHVRLVVPIFSRHLSQAASKHGADYRTPTRPPKDVALHAYAREFDACAPFPVNIQYNYVIDNVPKL